MSEKNAVILRFLVELRKRIIISLVVLAIIFFTLFNYANDLYALLARPLLAHLPHGQGLIATHVVSPFFVPFELTFFVSLGLAIPFFLHQLWSFVAPALYQHEKRWAWPLLLVSVLLFYLGIAFAYFVILPVIFAFLTKAAPQGVFVTPDIGFYLDFVLKLFFVFGCIFEVPVATILLIRSGVTNCEQLIRLRSYVIVGAFVVGMFLAPPDVLSQTLVAVPLWLLFEVGILLARFFSWDEKSKITSRF